MNAVVEIKQPGGALAAAQSGGRMAVADIISHVALVQEVMRAVMKPDVHFGKIPGTNKPTLYKAGAEVLCMTFRIADTYEVEDLSTPDMIRYRVNCIGTHQITGAVLGSGLGESSSNEEKYKWRKAVNVEEFEGTPTNMRRVKHARGSGGTFYKQEQVRTEPADLANTILKMANKRAKMAMTLNVTAASDCFAQDLEDMDEALRDHLTRHEDDEPQQSKPAVAMPQPKAAPKAAEPGITDAQPKGDGIARAEPDPALATVGEIAYILKKINNKGTTIADARELAGLDAGDKLDGLTKDGFIALKDALV
jgi:hypothetical protein